MTAGSTPDHAVGAGARASLTDEPLAHAIDKHAIWRNCQAGGSSVERPANVLPRASTATVAWLPLSDTGSRWEHLRCADRDSCQRTSGHVSEPAGVIARTAEGAVR
jgi:hypothetical protein